MMKTLRLRSAFASGVLLVLLLAGGCDSESPLGPLIVITNRWIDDDNEDHAFDFTAVGADSTREGTFTGTESLPDFVTVYDLEGFWEDGRVEFTVERTPPVTYRATVEEDYPTRFRFLSPTDTLMLVRSDVAGAGP